MSTAQFDFEDIVVGAGAAGSYCAYRLAHAGRELALCDSTGRVSGRLMSWMLHNGAPVELGGFSLSDADENTYGLCRRLELNLQPLTMRRGPSAFRGRHLRAADPRDLPYVFASAETGRHAGQLVLDALNTVLPTLPGLWPQQGNDPGETARFLRTARVDDQPLWRWGLWNLLSIGLSHEAYEYALASFGSVAALRNINAADAIWTLLRECAPGQTHFVVEQGFEQLPKALVGAAGVTPRFYHRLLRVDRFRSGVRVWFATPRGRVSYTAERVVLALPATPLRRLGLERLFSDGERYLADLDAVAPVNACKLFLSFETPWWRVEPLDSKAVLAGFTDQPMRQCYAFEPQAGDDGAVMMAVYADDAAATFWSGLAQPRGETREGLGRDDGCTRPTVLMIDAARRQLNALFPHTPAPAPVDGVFIDWSRQPSGAAWHAWKTGVRSWDVRERMRQPDPHLPLFICGEAFAETQGWCEGALNNAEAMLERHFGVKRPDWVGSTYVFER